MKRSKLHKPRIDRHLYNRLLRSFREEPGNYTRAAREAGVSRTTARKAWTFGWPDRELRPIRDVVEAEQTISRARRRVVGERATLQEQEEFEKEVAWQEQVLMQKAEKAEAAKVKAQEDAIEARTQEGQMVKLSRGNTMALMASAAKLLAAAIREARKLEERLAASDESEKEGKEMKGAISLSPTQTIKFIDSVSRVVRSSAEAAKITLEMERVLLGAPSEIVGIDLKNLDLNEAARLVGIANDALERAEKSGLLVSSAHPEERPN